MKPGLVLWGAGGHAKVVADVVRCSGIYQLEGFLDDVSPARWGQPFAGAVILGGRDLLGSLHARGIRHLIVAVGDNAARAALAGEAEAAGFERPFAVHPRATVAADATLGAGTVVMAGAVVNSFAALGRDVVVNTCASVDHDCTVGDGVHLAPGSRLAGNVTVGRGTFIGMGALVREKVRIGQGVVVGAGAVVLRDLPDGVTAVGVPARIRGSREGEADA